MLVDLSDVSSLSLLYALFKMRDNVMGSYVKNGGKKFYNFKPKTRIVDDFIRYLHTPPKICPYQL